MKEYYWNTDSPIRHSNPEQTNCRKEGQLIDECSITHQRTCINYKECKWRFNECYWLRFSTFCTCDKKER